MDKLKARQLRKLLMTTQTEKMNFTERIKNTNNNKALGIQPSITQERTNGHLYSNMARRTRNQGPHTWAPAKVCLPFCHKPTQSATQAPSMFLFKRPPETMQVPEVQGHISNRKTGQAKIMVHTTAFTKAKKEMQRK